MKENQNEQKPVKDKGDSKKIVVVPLKDLYKKARKNSRRKKQA